MVADLTQVPVAGTRSNMGLIADGKASCSRQNLDRCQLTRIPLDGHIQTLISILSDATNLVQKRFVEEGLSAVDRRLIFRNVISNSVIVIPLIGSLKRLIRDPVSRMRRSNRLTIIRPPVRLAIATEQVHALLLDIAPLAHVPVPDGEVDPLDAVIALVLLALVQSFAEADPVRRVCGGFRAPFACELWERAAFDAPLCFSNAVLDASGESVDSDVACAGTFGGFGEDCHGGEKNGEGS